MRNFDITWFLAVISLSGNIFNVKKKVACFYIWAIGEIFWFILDIKSGTYGRAFLDLIQFILAIWGIFEWQNNGKRGRPNGRKKRKNKRG